VGAGSGPAPKGLPGDPQSRSRQLASAAGAELHNLLEARGDSAASIRVSTRRYSFHLVREGEAAYPLGSTGACPREAVAIAQHVIGAEITECLIAVFATHVTESLATRRSRAARRMQHRSPRATSWSRHSTSDAPRWWWPTTIRREPSTLPAQTARSTSRCAMRAPSWALPSRPRHRDRQRLFQIPRSGGMVRLTVQQKPELRSLSCGAGCETSSR
jgi:hypothetical protein